MDKTKILSPAVEARVFLRDPESPLGSLILLLPLVCLIQPLLSFHFFFLSFVSTSVYIHLFFFP